MTLTEAPKEAANVLPPSWMRIKACRSHKWDSTEGADFPNGSQWDTAQWRGLLVPSSGQDGPWFCQVGAQPLKLDFLTILQCKGHFLYLVLILGQIKDTGWPSLDGGQKVQRFPKGALGSLSTFKISDTAACYITTLFIMWLFTIQTKIQKCSIWIQLNAKWWCFSWGHIPISSKIKKECTQVETGW